ncbi:hypothetical protein D8674_006926 [Pyrus ussuriensis x Pyrus communis]|uniref:Methyltransferase-related protein n=1 Tax=Pyrus ussuriensis x Pyrus communis TaxID=2448454 RepID=A0A5N5FVR4_9ROSA|nr:hypothetical protein D8674_006926 [Pyrus ussuriensis x Pyrus communis]
MCPLRLILIFLSATLAGFFVLRNLKSEGSQLEMPQDEQETHQLQNPNKSPHQFSKVRSAVESGFWTVVDMASGRYLWRHLASSTAAKQSD